MKHCEVFENIDSICQKFGITNYTLNSDGKIDIQGDVDIRDKGLSKLPLKFGKVSGNFRCNGNKLINLEGAPIIVGGSFYCGYNKLTSLEGSPKQVGFDFICSDNKLTTLEGSPIYVGGSFICDWNELISLKGCTKEISLYFYCSYNQLFSLEGAPRIKNGYIKLDKNPIFEIYHLFPDYKAFMDSLDYGYLRGTSIIKFRFQEALEEFGIEIPNEIKGWTWI